MSRILLVDDEPDIRLATSMSLSVAGWEIVEADSGEQALTLVPDGGFAAIVLDHRMPGLTGLETAQEARAKGYQGPIVLFSGYLTPEVEQSAQELGIRTLEKAGVRELRATLAALTGSA